MMLTTDMISAEDALKYNLINNVVEDIDSGINFDKDIDGFEYILECVKTSDFKEGIQAFKRKGPNSASL